MNTATRTLALVLVATTGCATTATTLPRPIASDIRVGAMGERTRFEQVPIERTAEGDDDDGATRAEKRRKSAFWGGIALLGIGTVGFLGFGIGGRVVQKQIDDGYNDGTLTRADEDKFEKRGELMNGLAIASAVVGLAGVVMASVTYGIDRTRCGKLKPRRDCGGPDEYKVPEQDRERGDTDDEGAAEADDAASE